jgi:hypothetical protein
MAAREDDLTFALIQGSSFDESQDGERLRAQHEAIWAVMQDGGWHTLESLQEALMARFGIVAKTTGISARIRDFSKPECGKHTVHDRRVAGHPSLWEHRLEVNPNHAAEIERYKRMNVRGKASVVHDTLIVDALVEQFEAALANIKEPPRHLKGFLAQLKGRLIPLAERHAVALIDGADQVALAHGETAANEASLHFEPEI